MGWRLTELFADIVARDERYRQQMRGVKRITDSVHASMMKLSMMSRRVLLVGGMAAVAALKTAADVEEMQSKFYAVFKEQSKAALEFANTLATATNLSRLHIMDFMSSLQDTFVPLGYTRERARELSEQLTTLAVDLASFYNIAGDETILNLTSALVGNHEAVRKFGIVITEGTIKQELFRMGIKKSYADVTNVQKVTARLNIIMRSTADAHGDAARTSGSFTNVMRGMVGMIREAAVAIGTAMIPEMQKAVQWLRSFAEAIADLSAKEMEGLIGSLKTVGLILIAVWASPVIIKGIVMLGHALFFLTVKMMAVAGVSLLAGAAMTALALGPLVVVAAGFLIVAHAMMKMEMAYLKLRTSHRQFTQSIGSVGNSLKALKLATEAQDIRGQVAALKTLIAAQEALHKQAVEEGEDAKQGTAVHIQARMLAEKASGAVKKYKDQLAGLNKALDELNERQAKQKEQDAKQAAQKQRFEDQYQIEKKVTSFYLSEAERRILAINEEARILLQKARDVGGDTVAIEKWRSDNIAKIREDARNKEEATERKRGRGIARFTMMEEELREWQLYWQAQELLGTARTQEERYDIIAAYEEKISKLRADEAKQRADKDAETERQTTSALADLWGELYEAMHGKTEAQLKRIDDWQNAMKAAFKGDADMEQMINAVAKLRRMRAQAKETDSPVFRGFEEMAKRVQEAVTKKEQGDEKRLQERQLVAQMASEKYLNDIHKWLTTRMAGAIAGVSVRVGA